MPSILGANTLSSGYDVANSARFNDGDSAYMNLTSVSTVTNRLKFTISLWVKRSTLGAKSMIGTVGGDNTNFGAIWFDSNDKLNCTEGSGGGELNFITNRVFRDVSAWYHIVLAIDTTQGTESNRVKIYVNGVQETSFGTSTYPSQNSNMHLNRGGKAQYLGRHTDSSNDYYFDGYMAEVVWIDGSQEAVTSFGEFDEDSPQIWKPIDVSGLTFGNNGFYLDFEDSANLGNDVNGGTDWTENNFAATDQSTDTCTNNFCTLNPLVKTDQITFSEGNCKWSNHASNDDTGGGIGTFGVTKGKWYFEVKLLAQSGNHTHGVISEFTNTNQQALQNKTGVTSWRNSDGGEVSVDGTVGDEDYGIMAQDSIMGIALDIDNYNISFYDDNTALASDINMSSTRGTIFPCITAGLGTTAEVNFGGCSAFAVSSAESDANGYGNFEHAPPSGYYALCTKNLAEFG